MYQVAALHGFKPELPAPAPEPPKPALLKLPPEICNQVFAELSPSSQICFSLTCKELYGEYSLKKKDLNGALNVTHNVLQLLERDLPSYFFCTNCVKLRRWRLRRDGSVLYIGRCDQGPRNTELEFPSRRYVRYTMNWRTIRLAYLHHMHGEGYGVPLSCLEKERLDLDPESAEESPVHCGCSCGYKVEENGTLLWCNSLYKISKIRDEETGGGKLVIMAFRTLDPRGNSHKESVVAFSGWDDLVFYRDGEGHREDDSDASFEA
ncbi:hypothetical protein PspLS_09445 [Pyricularia sp. CBS 133598]|nr:hypothetical protein PspLS_09445 [Pyricularia sp. CBS 133598]